MTFAPASVALISVAFNMPQRYTSAPPSPKDQNDLQIPTPSDILNPGLAGWRMMQINLQTNHNEKRQQGFTRQVLTQIIV